MRDTGKSRRSGRIWRSVRARATLAAVVAVSLALGIAVAGILSSTFSAVNSAVTTLARNQLAEVALQIKSGEVADPLPIPRGDVGVQIIDSAGRVAASTANISKLGPLAKVGALTNTVNSRLTLGGRGAKYDLGGDRTGLLIGERVVVPGDGLRVVKYSKSANVEDASSEASEKNVSTSPYAGTSVSDPSKGAPSVFLLAWASLGPTQQSTRATEDSLFVLFPILVLLVGLLVWYLTGRALAPVERIRSQVAGVSGTNLSARVQVPKTRDEISRLAATMNEMLSRLENSSERMRRFVADASHELRSPLASIRAQLEVSYLHPEASNVEETLAGALEEAERMGRIVDDLLTLAKLDESALAPRIDSVDLDELVLAEARRIRLQAGKAVDATGVGAARIKADRDQVFRVVRNLIDNASRHAVSTIAVSVHIQGLEVEMRVGDDGPGISPELAEKVFERFHRVEADRARVSGGSGLGLAIVASLVELNGGRVYLDPAGSSLGGAEFVVLLPLDADFLGEPGPLQPINKFPD